MDLIAENEGSALGLGQNINPEQSHLPLKDPKRMEFYQDIENI
jgi:hypothetical protein